MARPVVTHYFDYKSPYAWLAQEETFRLAEELPVEVDFIPHTLDIPSFLGEARLDDEGEDVLKTRSEHQWRRVRYAYRDCRREANRRGLTLLGPQRVFDTSLAHIAMLYAKRAGSFRDFHDRAYERFFSRTFDPEELSQVEGLLREVGIATEGFREFLEGEGRAEHDRLREEALAAGVFGVPSYLVEGELYWGAERLPRVREHVERLLA